MGKILERVKGRLLAMLGVRGPFRGNGEVFAAVDRLLCALEDGRHDDAAASVRRGFAALNGLTDGWEEFLAGLEKAEEQLPQSAGPRLRRDLKDLLAAVRYAVYR
ncbi:MAG: hypothetical protein ACYC2I_09475 [Elusimicrobiales bacterium]